MNYVRHTHVSVSKNKLLVRILLLMLLLFVVSRQILALRFHLLQKENYLMKWTILKCVNDVSTFTKI